MFAPFMINAWITASVVGVVSAVVGFFIAVRGQAFLAHALPNGAFAGAAMASLVNINPLLGLGIFSVFGAGIIAFLEKKLKKDTATALGFVLLLAIGALLLSLTTEYSQQIFALLFGEILGVSSTELLPTVILALVTLGLISFAYRPLLYSSVLEEVAFSKKVSPDIYNIVFLLIVALVTTMAIPVVGTLLIFTLLVAPAATARLISKTPKTALWFSVGLSLIIVYLSIAMAYWSNWPIGFFIGTLGVASYVAGKLYQKVTS
ncbi:MAG: metal ABC transporter permease [Firmicutes bacterium]|jgi:zinc/manganese transport system permease protein|nr:metal ABC transporter permease [Bacillota bacterium]